MQCDMSIISQLKQIPIMKHYIITVVVFMSASLFFVFLLFGLVPVFSCIFAERMNASKVIK